MRALLNGIFSARRLQLPTRPCLFECGEGADELEHYFCCKGVVAALAELHMIHPQGDWLAAWVDGPAAFGCGPYCTSRNQTLVLLRLWLYETHNDLRHNSGGAGLNVKSSILAFFSEHSSGRSRAFRTWRASNPQHHVPVSPAQLEHGLAALPAPVLVLARRDGAPGALGASAQE